MGELTHVDRGTGMVSRGFIGGDGTDQALQRQIDLIVGSVDTTSRDQARHDVRQGAALWGRLIGQHWESDRARQLYTRHYVIASEIASGRGQPSGDLLYGALLSSERQYREHQRKAREKAERQQPVSHLRARAAKEAMNPLVDFEPGRIEVLLATAKRDAKWVETAIVDAKARIDNDTEAQVLTIIYRDGPTLDIPLHPLTNMFVKPLPEADALRPFFRRHKSSGRLVPFQVTSQSYARMAYTGVPIDEVLNAVPPRFDPELTPRILTLRNTVNLRGLAAGFDFSTQAFVALSMATSVVQINPAGLAKGVETVGSTTAGVVRQAGVLAKAAISEVRVASYLPSASAAAYLGRSAWSFYLTHAVPVNLAAVMGAEIGLSFAGLDMGLVSPGDALVFIQMEKAGWQAIKTTVLEVDTAAHVAKLNVLRKDAVTADVAATYFDSGKLVHHEKKAGRVTPRDIKAVNVADDSKTASRAVDDRATIATAAKDKVAAPQVTKGKGHPQVTLAPLADSIHKRPLILLLDPTVEARALQAATDAIRKGLPIGEVGEAAARVVAEWTLKSRFPGAAFEPFDLNTILKKRFPGLDFISRAEAVSVKTYGVDAAAAPEVVARRIMREMLKLSGKQTRGGNFQPTTTARALKKYRADLESKNAWPVELDSAKTAADIEEYLKKTVFVVPNDLVLLVRKNLAVELIMDANVRGLFPELRSLPLDQYLATLSKFVQSRVTGVGLTVDQIKKLVAAAKAAVRH